MTRHNFAMAVWYNISIYGTVLELPKKYARQEGCEYPLVGIRIPFIMKPPLIYPSDQALSNFSTKKSTQMSLQIDNMIREQVLEKAETSPSYLWYLSTNLQPERTEQFHKRQTFQIVHPLSRTVLSAEQGLDAENRLEPSLLLPQEPAVLVMNIQVVYTSPAPQVPEGELQSDSLPNDLSVLTIPYGLSSAPGIFVTVTNWIYAEYLRKHSIRCVVYLGDLYFFLLANQSYEIKLANQASGTSNVCNNADANN